MPPSMQHDLVLGHRLAYAGLTRNRRPVVLAGQKKALALAVRGGQVGRSWSKPGERLYGGTAQPR